MKYINGPIKTYLKDLGGATCAPGGGSAAALSAAMAANLLAMAARFSAGREKYKKFDGSLRAILGQSLRSAKRLSGLLDEDVRAYYSKDFDRAVGVPAEICFFSADLIEQAYFLARRGNRNLITDCLAAAVLAQAAFMISFYNIRINLKFFKRCDKKHRSLLSELGPLSKKIEKTKKMLEVSVGSFIGRQNNSAGYSGAAKG